MGAEDQEKKIIVDEDWKAQVEAEKEAALHAEPAVGAEATPAADADSEPTAGADAEPTAGADAEPTADADTEPTTDAGDEVPQGADEDFPLPPPSFALLVTSFATQTLAAMGQIPDPVEGKSVVRLPVARHLIDSLAVLEEKTKGNLTAEEARLLDDALHQLRMAFVAVQQSAAAAPAPQESAEST